jgi:hypothetical protein
VIDGGQKISHRLKLQGVKRTSFIRLSRHDLRIARTIPNEKHPVRN